ncbi:MAG: FG-GAP repeat protein [Phycisphaerae bacterium]|nr:FG-GAP repeat protein [Phycisphaerae bacterium]
MRSTRKWRPGLGILAVSVATLLPLLLGQGCPDIADLSSAITGNISGSLTGTTTLIVHSPSVAQTVRIGDALTMVYDVSSSASNVVAFYDRDGVAGSGDEVVFATSLAAGTGKVVTLQTGTLAAGTLRVGIRATIGLQTLTAYAPGVVTLQAGVAVTWVSPAAPVSLAAGASLPIEFDAGTTQFQYRLFYDRDTTVNSNETTIHQATVNGSSTVERTFNTASLTTGVYNIGVVVTPATGSPIASYNPATLTVTTGVYMEILSPTVGLVVQPGEFVQVLVAANDPSNPTASVRTFYDPDTTFGNGNETTIATFPASVGGTNWNTTGVITGEYYVGAELLNGQSPPLTRYSAGVVQVGSGGGGTGEASLSVTSPLTAASILEGNTYRINWTTNLRRSEGTVRVFREPDADNDGEPDGEATRVTIVDGLEALTQFVDFKTTGAIGKFFIGATLTPVTGDPVTDYAPGTLTVVPKTFWVGDFATKRDNTGNVVPQTGFARGAIFRGHNFGDNLGSALLAADDYDGDGRNEIIMGAQFGKPFFARAEGRGAGEAYLIYGQAARYSGHYYANSVGLGATTTTDAALPGTILTGVVPNPYAGDDLVNVSLARAGSSIPYTVEGGVAQPYATEGLRSITLIPDQDGDNRQELVFGFPYCNSFSLSNQVVDGIHPAPLPALGRLENNGHFLRGGVITLSSRNSLLANRRAVSRHFDRVIQLDEVGQVFEDMGVDPGWGNPPSVADVCPNFPNTTLDGTEETIVFPCEGFFQSTEGTISPPRLATSLAAGGLVIAPETTYCMGGEVVNLSQIDPPPGPSELGFIGGRQVAGPNGTDQCTPNVNLGPIFGEWPLFGTMAVLGTGFYSTGVTHDTRVMSPPREPYGCRILGQTTSQCPDPAACLSTANRFGHSVSTSGDFLLVGAPLRTALRAETPSLPTATREQAGEVYMLQLKRPGAPDNQYLWTTPAHGDNETVPAPHNYIIGDLGYVRAEVLDSRRYDKPGDVDFEISNPIRIIGASAGDQVGDVTGLADINNDGVDDVAVGAPGAARMPNETFPRGAVYVLYRRQPEIEADYLLEDLARDPASDPQRLNGLMIIGQPGENIGRSLAGGGDLNDDYNKDGYADLLIGSPDAFTAGGAQSGEVFILFGGRNLLNPAGGITLGDLRDAGYGMLLTGAGTGHHAGITVANAGDFNGDGTPDILIAAPDASPSFTFTPGGDGTYAAAGTAHGVDLDGNGVADDRNLDGDPDDLTGAGVVYVVFGGTHLTGTISLGQIGSDNLPGVMFVGSNGGDALGGGLTQNGLLSKGVASAGDLDGDGRADLLMSSILASPEGKTAAGEVYLIYGFKP